MSNILCDGGLSFIYSHLVIAAKFNMVVTRHKQKGGNQVYIFLAEDYNHI